MAGELLLDAYPLTWPERQPRTAGVRRRAGKFEASLGKARDELLEELRRLRARHVVVSSNVPVRRDGLPYADAREPLDPGVAVYFERHVAGAWKPFVIACDAFTKVRFNLRAVGLTVEALRAIERHGSTAMLEQAFTGFAALPPASPTEAEWWVTLDLHPNANAEEIRAAHRELARRHHPDVGGNADLMVKINRARDVGLARLSGGPSQ